MEDRSVIRDHIDCCIFNPAWTTVWDDLKMYHEFPLRRYQNNTSSAYDELTRRLLLNENDYQIR